jgi:hypothetical protein
MSKESMGLTSLGACDTKNVECENKGEMSCSYIDYVKDF